MDLWRRYLFEAHPETTLRAWARRLRLFRFCRAYGGHANDGDSLEVLYRYDSLEELGSFLGALGVHLVFRAEAPPRLEPGRAYRGDEFARFVSLIPGTRWVEQPGHCRVAGHKAFVWCEGDQVRLSLHSGWAVTAADVAAAEQVEWALHGATLDRVDPPTNNRHCICPMYYPAYFV